MKQFTRFSAWILALALIVGILPAFRLNTKAAEPTVGSAVAYATFSSEDMVVDGKFSEAAYRLDYPFAKKLSFGLAWDWENLYLAVSGSTSSLSSLVVNGVSLNIYGTGDGSNREIKKADGIYLMQHINCTGVLIECGFLSNTQEEALLRTIAYQQKLNCVIAGTLSEFLTD